MKLYAIGVQNLSAGGRKWKSWKSHRECEDMAWLEAKWEAGCHQLKDTWNVKSKSQFLVLLEMSNVIREREKVNDEEDVCTLVGSVPLSGFSIIKIMLSDF